MSKVSEEAGRGLNQQAAHNRLMCMGWLIFELIFSVGLYTLERTVPLACIKIDLRGLSSYRGRTITAS